MSGYWKIRVFSISLLVVCCVSSVAWAGTHPQYEIEAAIDTASRFISAHQKVTFTNNTSASTDALYFHIYPNRRYTSQERAFLLRYAGYFKVDPYPDGFPQDLFKVQNVTQDGNDISFVIEGEDRTILKVILAKPLQAGESVTVQMHFTSGIPRAYGRYGFNERVTALSRWYPILSVYDASGWSKYPFYPFHRPFFSEASDYRVRLTVPAGETVIHTGDLVKEEYTGTTKTLELTTPLPVREFTLAMSADYQHVESQLGPTTVKSYYLPGREARGREALENAIGIMKFYGEKFGEYPYKNYSIAPVYLGYGGEQMSNLIFIDTRVYDLPKFLPRYFDFLIAHETGHQWFYNILGIDSFKEIWMEEGFNSYFLLEYLEHKYGPNADVVEFSRLPKWLQAFFPQLSFRNTRGVRYKMMARQGLDHPIVDKLSGYTEPSSIFSLAYGKGSIVVGMLKELIGDDAFKRVYSRIFKEYAYRNLSLSDFKRICYEEHGADFGWFFDQWLHSDKQYDMAVVAKGDQLLIEKRGGVDMPTDIVVKNRDGSQEHFSSGGGLSFPRKSVKSVSLDPDQKWLDIDRTNNHWPRRIHFKAVPLYYPLYDLPLFLPEDSYNVVIGPEISDGVGVKTSLQKPYDQIFYGATSYDLNEQWHTSRVGYELQNVFNRLMTFGAEVKNRTDYDDGDEDLVTAKMFLRQELWPAAYGLTDVNDHISLYLIRNQSLRQTKSFGGAEDITNMSYLRNEEAIVGTALHLGRSRPYPDPREGYTLDALIENSGHFLGATQQFTRASLDYRVFAPVTRQSKLGVRAKYGWGSVDDKNLFELGGIDGLRGFDRKTVRGANAFLGSVEYRFPILSRLNLNFFDNVIGLRKISGVGFFDAGQSWYDSFKDSKLRRDAGAGLRFHLAVGSFLEEVIVRVDAARAISDDEDDVHFWFGIKQAF